MSRQRVSLGGVWRFSSPLLAPLLLLPLPGAAQTAPRPVPNENWKCELCIGTPGFSLALDAGPAFVLDDAFAFGDYTGLDKEGAELFGDFFGRYRGTGITYANFEGYLRGADAYGLFAEVGRQGIYQMRMTVQSVPRRLFDDTRTPLQNVGTANLSLPSSWVAASTTGQMTALQSTAQPFEIGYDRQRYGLELDYSLQNDLAFNVEFRRQERDGVVRSSGAFLFSALEFASPVDYVTDDVEVSLAYSKDKWQASASYFNSAFRNDSASVSWDNPYSAIRGADQGQQALAPDNDAHRVTLAASVLLPARTTVNGHLGIGRLRQSARLLPFTTNPTLAPGPLPTPTADAEVDTMNFEVRAVTSPWPKLTFEGELRLNDFDNTTPGSIYNYVVTDVLPSETPARSTAYDYERRQAKVRGEYRFLPSTRLSFGADTERFERSLQDRRRTTTDRLWVATRSRIGGVSELAIDLFTENRNGSNYDSVIRAESLENPLMRKYNLADREREGLKMRTAWFGGARADVGVEIEFSEDRYDESLLGLTDTDYERITADFSWLLGTSGSVYASVSGERIQTSQANSQSFSLPDWAATTDDEFATTMVGAKYPGLFDRIDAELALTWVNSRGSIDNNTTGLASSYPDLKSRRRTVHLRLSYPFSERLRLGFDYFVEKFTSDDWALDGVDLASVPNLLSLGAAAWNYEAAVAYFNVSYRLGQ